MRVFKSAWFVRFARREGISDLRLQEAVRRANLGQVDADLGGYAKSRRAGIRPDETEQFKRMAKHILTLSDAQLDALVAGGGFEEVADNDEAVPK